MTTIQLSNNSVIVAYLKENVPCAAQILTA